MPIYNPLQDPSGTFINAWPSPVSNTDSALPQGPFYSQQDLAALADKARMNALLNKLAPAAAPNVGVQPPQQTTNDTVPPAQLTPPGGAGGALRTPSELQKYLDAAGGEERHITAALAGMRKALDGRTGVEQQAAREMADVHKAAANAIGMQAGQLEGEQEATKQDWLTVKAAQATERQRVEDAVKDMGTAYQYPYAEGSPSEVRSKVDAFQSILNDPSASQKEKLAARRGLQQMEEPDPDRIYGGSFGKRIMAALAMAFGAYGSALTKTPNYAYQIINDAIERDIAAQKEKAAGKRSAAGEQVNYWKWALQQSHSEEQAYWVAKTFLTNQALQIMQLRMNQAGEAGQAAQLRLSIDKLGFDNELNYQNAVITGSKAKADIEMKKGELVVEEDKVKAAETAAGAKAGKVPDQVRFLQNAARDLRQLIEMRDKLGSEHVGGAKNEMQSLAGNIEINLASAWRNRGLSKDAIHKMIGDVTGVGFVEDRLKQTLDSIEQDLANYSGGDAGADELVK